jgi:ADP-ribosylglycohydrolase
LLGAIAGDIIGSAYENVRTKRKDFRLITPLSTYTDDTVLTVAVADAILRGRAYGPALKAYARRRPFRGYGPRFLRWAVMPGIKPYNSLGNGSAMRVSPVAHAFRTEEEVLEQAKRSAECTHDHPEGVKGAQAVALAVFMARRGADKRDIRAAVSGRFGYDLSRTVDEIRPFYAMDPTCPGSVPEAVVAFLDSADFEDAVRNAVSLGGDADTQAAIAGAIAEAFYKGVPEYILGTVWKKIPQEYRRTIVAFYGRFGADAMIRTLSESDRTCLS